MECRRARIYCTAALSGCDSGMELCIEYTVDEIGRTAGKDMPYYRHIRRFQKE